MISEKVANQGKFDKTGSGKKLRRKTVTADTSTDLILPVNLHE